MTVIQLLVLVVRKGGAAVVRARLALTRFWCIPPLGASDANRSSSRSRELSLLRSEP
jgi:hypothetical protein